MRIQTILRILGILLMIFSLSMLTPLAFVEWAHDSSVFPFLCSFGVTFFTGAILWMPFRHYTQELKVRDGFLVVVLFWVVLSLFGALPFVLAHDPHCSFTDAIFETVSGLTTTGASVFSGLDFFPMAVIYYRQQLQFLGGMGIIVLAVAILPMLGIGGMQLYRAEVPGPIKDSKLTPRITETAKTLWYIYVVLNIIGVFAFWLSGMTLFDAVGETFATISTGGFSMHNTSFAYYHSSLIEIVGSIFMILGGANFSLHFMALKQRSIKPYWQDVEFKAYIAFMFVVVAISAALLIDYQYYVPSSISVVKAIFNVTSLITTTGFVSGDFSHWPTLVPYLLMAAALIGGCGGSTAGGIKVIRALLAAKQGTLEIKRLIHPRSIFTLKLGKEILPEHVTQAIWSFIVMFFMLFLVFILILLSQGVDIETAIGAVTACIANVGAGIGGISKSFEPLNAVSKWTLIFSMLIGRLEVFTILVLFTPEFWRK